MSLIEWESGKSGSRIYKKEACHSERSGVSAANGTQSRNPAKQRLAWIAGFAPPAFAPALSSILDSAKPGALQQSEPFVRNPIKTPHAAIIRHRRTNPNWRLQAVWNVSLC